MKPANQTARGKQVPAREVIIAATKALPISRAMRHARLQLLQAEARAIIVFQEPVKFQKAERGHTRITKVVKLHAHRETAEGTGLVKIVPIKFVHNNVRGQINHPVVRAPA